MAPPGSAGRRASASDPPHGAGRDVLDALRAQRGHVPRRSLREATGRLPVEVEEGLWDLVARGIVTADGFQAVRSLLSARQAWKTPAPPRAAQPPGGAPGSDVGARGARDGGPCSRPRGRPRTPTRWPSRWPGQLLARWGVVFWDLMARENLALPWREVVWALRRLEARGLVRGGRFVTGFAGEQYALPEAIDELRRVRRAARDGETVHLNARRPAEPGRHHPARGRGSRPSGRTRVTYRDGLPVDTEHATTTPGPATTSRPRRPGQLTG